MILVKDQFDPELRRLISKKKQIAVIPIGSIEQHGPHLPVSTDSDIVTEIAKEFVREKNIFYYQQFHMVYPLSTHHFSTLV